MKKMNAITFAKTGHVLGVVTRATQPDAAATPAQIAAGGFRLRDRAGDNVVVTIPESEIGVALVDYDTRVLHYPHRFALENGQPEQKTDGSPPNLAITLDGAEITATLPANVAASTSVWCQISGGALTEPIVRSVTIPGTVAAPTKIGKEPLALSAGNYRVAMFAPGYAVAVFEETVP